jgi:lipoprotein-releasing system permease protein
MIFERFIAKRFMPHSKDGGGFSGPLSVVAVASIALGVVVMLVAVCILRGFQGEIREKVAGFGSHLTVSNYVMNATYQETPVTLDTALLERIKSTPGVRQVQCYATKGGMVKTQEQIYGILLRGLSDNFDTSFFAENLTEGRLPLWRTAKDSLNYTNEVLVSSTISKRLHLKVGDKLRCYFWEENNYRARAFSICGIYNTDLTEMDELYVIGALSQVQSLNQWGDTLVGGYELLVEDFDQLDRVAMNVLDLLPYSLTVVTVKQSHPSLFAWLDLLDSNINLILVIMSIVCIIAIISALLIMIFEKGRTIGLLKALGATNRSVRHIFLIKSMRLILKGILIGDAVAIILCGVQQLWAPLKLDPESYHMEHVPVDIDPMLFLFISAGTLAVCLVALLLPAGYISRISPAKTMRNE